MIEEYEEFQKLTIDELIRKVNSCFAAAHHAANNQIMGSHGPAGHLLEAQFYMKEIDRRHSEIERQESRNIARRDFRLELIIIFLIALELIVAIAGVIIALREGSATA